MKTFAKRGARQYLNLCFKKNTFVSLVSFVVQI